MQHLYIVKRSLTKYALISGLFLFTVFATLPVPFGLDEPVAVGPYLNGSFPSQTPGTSKGDGTGPWKAVNAFPNLTFIDPIALEEIPDGSGFFVASKKGYIYRIAKDINTDRKDVVLDITQRTTTGGDAGLNNFVLHPEFGQVGSPNRGYIYLMYRHHDSKRDDCGKGVDRLSRFTMRDGSNTFDPASELILIQQYSESCVHMGSGMFFGSDGFLYFTIGDGGGGGGRYRLAQTLTRGLFAGLFRIDIDSDPSRSHPIRRQPEDFSPNGEEEFKSFTQGYYIPNDNPWQGPAGNIMEEYYAMGLRSPHRATFDPVKEEVWIGDVGELTREEILIARKGGNYQWPYREGSIAGPIAKPNSVIGKEYGPFFDYGRSEGNCVIGGFVYRGSKWKSALGGLYLFGDHGTRNVWTIDPNNEEVNFIVNIPAAGRGSKNGIASFGTDLEGNVYILKVFETNTDGGVIYKLDRDGSTSVGEPPKLLSQTGAFRDLQSLTPAPGLVPYSVNTPLWSDGALKKRWIALPNDGKHNVPDEEIFFTEKDGWQFPKGTVFIKHFEMPINANDIEETVRLETRFFIITEDGGGYGITYRWNEAGTDAELLESSETRLISIGRADGSRQNLQWTFPSRTQCMTCHTPNAGFVLGVHTAQMNRDVTYSSTGITDNQLATWNHLGMFSQDIAGQIASLPAMVSLDDATADLEDKVSSYLDANCAHCHRPSGVEGIFDARYSIPMDKKKIIDTEGISRNTPIGSVLVKPGEVESSHLYQRDATLGTGAMPPIGKTINDDPYLTVLAAWINSLKPDPIDPTEDPLEETDPIEEDPIKDDPDKSEEEEEEPGLPMGVEEFWLEAECGDLGAQWDVIADPAASGGYLVQIPNQNLKFINNASDDPRFTISYPFVAAEAGLYKVFLRSIAPNSGDDSFWVRINDIRWVRFNNIDKSEQLLWDQVHDNTKGNQAVLFEVKKGENTLQVSLREDGTAFDKIFITKTGVIPQGNGGEAETCERDGGILAESLPKTNFSTVEGSDSFGTNDEFELSVGPNPFKNSFGLSIRTSEKALKRVILRIYDTHGRIVHQRFNVPLEERLEIRDLSNFEPGVYFLRVQAGSKSDMVRLVKH